MTTTRYFEVKVENCQTCPNNDEGVACDIAPFKQWKKVFNENKDQLTDSCPMWNETKESETKCLD